MLYFMNVVFVMTPGNMVKNVALPVRHNRYWVGLRAQ